MEIIIFAVTIPFLWYFWAKTKIGKPLPASMFTAAVFEIVNETVFAKVGTFYPEVLVPFPFFKFPLAIILLGGFYSGIINFAALKISKFFKNRYLSLSVFLFSLVSINTISILVEKAGIYSGFWQHRQPGGISNIYFEVYVYYLLIVLPASVFIASGLWRRSSQA